MDDSGTPPEGPDADLRHELRTITAFGIALLAGLVSLPLIATEGLHSRTFMLLWMLWALLHNIAHYKGIWLDCLRRRREIGGWASFAFWFGPITTSFYLAFEYKSRSPALLAVYWGFYGMLFLAWYLSVALLAPEGWTNPPWLTTPGSP